MKTFTTSIAIAKTLKHISLFISRPPKKLFLNLYVYNFFRQAKRRTVGRSINSSAWRFLI
ncbi:MAG: hypothetical protein A2017_09230 [Lentisphaerae bacterium GWF2_44_16]|nr:MAG: hypothetical protein A2017_09230 [Lentisphaerae bacterium GWF2_44_16]